MKNKLKVDIIHGPNLNMLGKREPLIYGKTGLEEINSQLEETAGELGVLIETFQSNHEGDIVEKIHQVFQEKSGGVIINPGALTHTSVAVRDALLLLDIPVVEVHLSNIYKREKFRQRSLFSDIVTGQITGLGSIGYTLALRAVAEILHAE